MALSMAVGKRIISEKMENKKVNIIMLLYICGFNLYLETGLDL